MNPIVFIPLTKGKVAVVDFADFDLVRGFSWNAQKAGRHFFYAKRSTWDPVTKKRGTLLMHTVIAGQLWVDHRNGNGLDNRRQNLRPATRTQNFQSLRRRQSNSTNRFKGVRQHPETKKWEARIQCNGRRMQIGSFMTEQQAARAWDAAAKMLGFADEALNFPPPRPADFEIL